MVSWTLDSLREAAKTIPPKIVATKTEGEGKASVAGSLKKYFFLRLSLLVMDFENLEFFDCVDSAFQGLAVAALPNSLHYV